MAIVDLLISGGTIVTGGTRIKTSIAVDGGKVVGIGSESVLPKGDRVIDASGLYVIPGVIDLHAHLREPGYAEKEDFLTGTQAAAAGGVTMVVDMPNTNPPPNTLERYLEHRAIAKSKALVDFGHWASPTIVKEIPKIAKEGASGFKIYMKTGIKDTYPYLPEAYIGSSYDLLHAFQSIQETGLTCVVHPWNQEMWERIETKYRERGMLDPESYYEAFFSNDCLNFTSAIAPLLDLQRSTGVKLALAHTNYEPTLSQVRRGKRYLRHLYAELNPGSLFFAKDDLGKKAPYFHAFASIGRKPDREAVWEALNDGTIDYIATDHAPHTLKELADGWRDQFSAPSGAPHLEHYLSMLLTEVGKGRITLERLVALLCENPARIAGVFPQKGSIRIGSDADMTIVNMKVRKRVSPSRVYTKIGWTPYIGKEISGEPVMTMVRGEVVMEGGVVLGNPGYGQNAKPINS